MNSPTFRGSKGNDVLREIQVSIKVRKLRKYSEKTEVGLFTLEKGSKSTTISPSEFLYLELTLWANFLLQCASCLSSQ